MGRSRRGMTWENASTIYSSSSLWKSQASRLFIVTLGVKGERRNLENAACSSPAWRRVGCLPGVWAPGPSKSRSGNDSKRILVEGTAVLVQAGAVSRFNDAVSTWTANCTLSPARACLVKCGEGSGVANICRGANGDSPRLVD